MDVDSGSKYISLDGEFVCLQDISLSFRHFFRDRFRFGRQFSGCKLLESELWSVHKELRLGDIRSRRRGSRGAYNLLVREF